MEVPMYSPGAGPSMPTELHEGGPKKPNIPTLPPHVQLPLYHLPNHPADQQLHQQWPSVGWHSLQTSLSQPDIPQPMVPTLSISMASMQAGSYSYYPSVASYNGYTHRNPDLSQQTLQNDPFSTIPRSLSNSTSGISSGIEMANTTGPERGSSYPPLPETDSLGASPYGGSYYSGGGYFDANSGFSSQGESQ